MRVSLLREEEEERRKDWERGVMTRRRVAATRRGNMIIFAVDVERLLMMIYLIYCYRIRIGGV